jgi:hypothetical protein
MTLYIQIIATKQRCESMKNGRENRTMAAKKKAAKKGGAKKKKK